MSGIPGKIKLSVVLSPESEPTSLEVSGIYNPDSDEFTYIPLGRGGQPRLVHNAGSMLVLDKSAQPSEAANATPSA